MNLFNKRKTPFRLGLLDLPVGFRRRVECHETDGDVMYIERVYNRPWHGHYAIADRKMFRESGRGIIAHRKGAQEFPRMHKDILRQLDMKHGKEMVHYIHLEDR